MAPVSRHWARNLSTPAATDTNAALPPSTVTPPRHLSLIRTVRYPVRSLAVSHLSRLHRVMTCLTGVQQLSIQV